MEADVGIVGIIGADSAVVVGSIGSKSAVAGDPVESDTAVAVGNAGFDAAVVVLTMGSDEGGCKAVGPEYCMIGKGAKSVEADGKASEIPRSSMPAAPRSTLTGLEQPAGQC